MEIDYNAVFGIEAGANETETADPSTDETSTTAPENETMEDADTVTEETETEGEKKSEPAEQTEQSKEENAKYAAIRRKAEQDAAAKAQETVNNAFKALNLTNPYTGKPVTNQAEFEEYGKALAEERKSQMLERSGMSQEDFDKLVNDLPEVQKARAVTAERDREQQQKVLETELAEIGKYDPTIKTLEDLQKQENYQQIYDKVMHGMTISDAYYVVNKAKIIDSAAAKAKQSAAINSAGKAHMTSTVQHGQGAMTVPKEVMEQYRVFFPKATEAEITAHYNKHHKKG